MQHGCCFGHDHSVIYKSGSMLLLQEARKWAGGQNKNESLDYSEKSDGVKGASDADSGAESINMQQKSLVDIDEEVDSDDSEEASSKH